MRLSPTMCILSASVVLSASAALSDLQASEAVGPRALGMGGVGVACAEDYVAQYYNPAAFGFFGHQDAEGKRYAADNQDLARKDWGMGFDVTATYIIAPSLGRYLNKVLDSDVSKLSTLGQAGSDNAEILEDAVNTLAAVSEFNPEQDYVGATADAGLGLRIGHFGLGARMSATATGAIRDLDTKNLGLALGGFSSVAQAVGSIKSNLAAGYTPQTLTEAQVQQLTTTLSTDKNGNAVNPTDVTAAINNIDNAVTTAGLSGSNVQSVVDQFGNLVNGSSAVSTALLTDNTTNLRLVGLALAEIPVSYGVALDEHWSIGGSLKYMLGRVYGSRIQLLDVKEQNIERELNDALDEYAQSSNFGVDIGIQGRFNMFQVGLTGRNLNGPSFDGPTILGVEFEDIRVDPSVTAGVAFIPTSTVTLAADLDLTQTQSVAEIYSTQFAGLGFEWNAFHFLALRAGVRKNIAESDSNVLYSAGLGMNLYVLRIDLAAQASAELVEYDGDQVPQNGAVSLAIATDW